MYIYIKLLILFDFIILMLPPDVCSISFGPPPLISPSTLRLLISPLTKKSDDTRPPDVLAFRLTCICGGKVASILPPEVFNSALRLICCAKVAFILPPDVLALNSPRTACFGKNSQSFRFYPIAS